MEVWAIEAYGAAHCLQEFLTVNPTMSPAGPRCTEADMSEEHFKGQSFESAGLSPRNLSKMFGAAELRALGVNIELIPDG